MMEAKSETVIPELTLALIGDTNSIEIGPDNILTNHDNLYNMWGRHIPVINLLGYQSFDEFPSEQGIHAFVLLLKYGQHSSQYSSGVQWLEEAFGERSLSYLMTVVTHYPEERCENAKTDLKANSSFDKKRYLTCSRNMMGTTKILLLLESVNVMVSQNDPQAYSKQMFDENKEQRKLTFSRNRLDSSWIQNQRDEPEKTVDETEIKAILQSRRVSEETNRTSEETNRKEKHQVEIEKLFRRLHLQKLSAADFLKIGPSVDLSVQTWGKDLAHTFLQRLIMLDYRARYVPVEQGRSVLNSPMSDSVFDAFETEESDLDVFYSTSDQSKREHVHPMDFQMAVFHYSDSFLKQTMITKLSQCQYALPLLVPDAFTNDLECPLWTFRQINKTWKTQSKDKSNTVTMKSVPIHKAETPMVSFFRLGSVSVSKSQLLNTLFNDRHNTFFHRNCPGSTNSRLLMDGVAEIAWYCPAGKPNDAFTDCIAFSNLHGDALLFEQQRDILTEQSSINVVLVPTLKKGDKSSTVISALFESPKPLICLIVDDGCNAVETEKVKYTMGLKDRSQADVSAELKRIIGEILSGPHKSFQLEAMENVSGIRVDEDDTVCLKAKTAAKKILILLKGMDASKIKDTFLPCQGELWHKCCRINEELYQLKGHIEKEKYKKQDDLKKIRQDQCTASCSEVIKVFTERLSSLPPTDKEYFLKWTQILIDALSTDDLTSILQSYDEKWSEVLALKKTHDKSDLLKTKQTELEQISQKLQSASFGLEHIFREMGQIYEAHKSLQKQPETVQSDWSKYPELAAELMILGHPMELMDGDAGHVPLTWISSLLDEVIRKLGDQRVFVLSVLGVQSSGKSTMLNAMFGLQFAVSAGRCTKGAYMQLVSVSEEMKKDFHFDYVLVVDTEGLRALELEGNTTGNDNELATFVVGLGNMTLINIFGENPADMQDVLQIVVQGLVRMKKVKLSPSCVFVHQNVTDVAAAEKNMDGKRRLKEKLDQMVQRAAKEEGSDAQCFSDITAFDVQTDVKYVDPLWEGSPPMAPPNPGYSESVQELKNFILSKASQSAGVTLSQFRSKIQDLWNALMNEHFVFSFKNTLEIKVYRKLEVQYLDWTWALRSNMLTTEKKLHRKIESGKLEKAELCYRLNDSSTTYGDVHKHMKTYFEDNRDKEMLVQWRSQIENKIKEFHDERVEEVKRRLDEVLQQKEACRKMDEQKTEFEKKLLQKSKELAQQVKDEARDEMEFEKQFKSVWSHWVTELTADIQPIDDINLQEDQFIVLQALGIECTLIVEAKSSGRYKTISGAGNYFDYVSLSSNNDPNQQSQALQDDDQQHIRSLIEQVEKQSLDEIRSKPVVKTGYRVIYLQDVANNVNENVTEFESKWTCTLKKEFRVDLILHVFDRAETWILESHNTFKMNNDAATFVKGKETQYYSIFRSFCKGSSSAVVLGEMICEKLMDSTVEAVCYQTIIDLAGEMRCSLPAFNGNRLNLEKHLLKSLAEKEDFDGFITYIKDPRKQMETFIKEEGKKYVFTEHKDEALSLFLKNVEDVKKMVSEALSSATEKVKNQGGDTNMWMKEFTSSLKDELTFETIGSENFTDINNFDFLKEEVEKGLLSITTEMSSLLLDKMEDFRMITDQLLINQLCKCCWVKCPFCGAVCTNTLEDHSPEKHSVPFHRPSGIGGFNTRNTVDLVVNFCTTLVASDGGFHPNASEESVPYKQYPNGGERLASWEITADQSKLTYWKWFVCRFQKELEDHYKLKFQNRGEIPEEWRNYTKEDALKSLDEMYNV